MTQMRRWLFVGMGALVFAACGGGGGATAPSVPVASVTVTPATATVGVGATMQLTATTKDASGNVLTGRTVTWASSNTAVATVSGTGLVTGVAAGLATITATSEGKNGTAAITVQTSSAAGSLFGVWALASNRVYAVGDGGTILGYNGTSWSPVASGTTNTLYRMGPGLFVVGAGGTILSYNGTSWTPQTSGTTNNLYGLSRTPPGGTIVVVGAGGAILHYDGTNWIPQTSGTTNALYAVTKVPMLAANFAVGVAGTILHYDGTNWTGQTSGTTNDLFFVGALSATNVYAFGAAGTVLHYDGTNWSRLVISGITVTLHQADIAATPTGTVTDFFVVGDGGTILHSSDAVTWSQQASGTANNLFGVSVVSASDVFAVGAGGIILHYDGTAWSKQR